MKKEYFQDPNLKKERWKWRLIAENNEKIAEADEGFSSRQAAKKNLELIKSCLSGGYEHGDTEEHVKMVILGCLVLKMQTTIHYLIDLTNEFVHELKEKNQLTCEAGLARANKEIARMQAERNKRIPLEHDQEAVKRREKRDAANKKAEEAAAKKEED